MYLCSCGYAAETEGCLMSHFIERHRLSYNIELHCPLGSEGSLAGGFETFPYGDRHEMRIFPGVKAGFLEAIH